MKLVKNHPRMLAAATLALVATVATAGYSSIHSAPAAPPLFVQQTTVGPDINNMENPFIQSQDPALSGNGRDQSLQNGEIIFGSGGPDLLIGRLGADIFVGGTGDDVILGGLEHFTPPNRDRAFGMSGNDTFVWKPGDGSDFFDGGPGIDTVVFGVVGEVTSNGVEFAVVNDGQAGDAFINPQTNLPLVDVVNSPGFCEIKSPASSPEANAELEALDLDHLVSFFIRPIADAFEAGMQTTDNGLRVTLHLRDVEVIVCTARDGGEAVAYNLTVDPPQQVPLFLLPTRVLSMLTD